MRHKSSGAHAFAFAFQSLVQPDSFHHSSLQLSVQFAAPVFPSPYYFTRRFINRSRNNLVSPSPPDRRAILFFAASSLVPIGPAWAPRIVHPGPYFNINFPDGDTSFASAWPHISSELIIIRIPFLLYPAVARAQAPLPLFFSLPLQGRTAYLSCSKLMTLKHFRQKAQSSGEQLNESTVRIITA